MTATCYALDVESPVGTLRLVADEDALVALDLPGRRGAELPASPGHPLLARAAAQLAAYFGGRRQEFDLPLRPAGTPFQRAVWEELRRIPFGTTCSYAALAQAVGRSGAARAVGAANGQNPIAIVIPCHRVIGASGALTGYGGGLPLKRWLLAHERSVLGAAEAPAPGTSRQRRLHGM